MKLIKNIINPALFVLGIGVLLRVLIAIACYTRFSEITGVFYAVLIGLIYDFSFISGVFCLYIGLSFFLRSKGLNLLFTTTIYVWVLLNATDIWSIKYTGFRLCLNSFNLFSFEDLYDKAFELSTILPFLFFLIVSIWLTVKLRKKILPSVEEATIKQKLSMMVVLFVFTLVYLPFPISYYSNQIKIPDEAKQLSLNPYYSWTTSFINSSNEYLLDPEVALGNFKLRLRYDNTKSLALDRKVNYLDSSYENIVIVIMESFGANRIGALGGEKQLSPYFDSLCKDGTLYTKCFACGPRTQYGISSILFGFPHILSYNLFRQNKLRLPFHGLGEAVTSKGYRQHFLHGGNANYDDMSLLLKTDAPIIIKDSKDIESYLFKNSWGVDDESLFNYSADFIASQSGKNIYYILSMSNHEPFQTPANFKTDATLQKSENTFAYSDYALGVFINKLKRNNQFEKTLLIITGDHGENYSSSDAETKLFHVPLLIVDHKSKRIKSDVTVSHADIAEYVLSKIDYSGSCHFIGQGLVSTEKQQVYYRDYDNNLFKVTDSLVYKYSIQDETLFKLFCQPNMYVVNKLKVTNNSEEYESVSNEIKSYYTSCKFVFENGLYKNK